MPELPEVESARRLVARHLLHVPISSVVLTEQGGGPRNELFDNIIMPIDAEDRWGKELVGKSLVAACRRGKHLYLELGSSGGKTSKFFGSSSRSSRSSSNSKDEEELHLLFHFGMTGSFAIEGMEVGTYKSFKVDKSNYPPKFTKFELVFQNGKRLSFADPRRLGRIKLVSGNPLKQPPLASLAIDPLLDDVGKDYFLAKLKDLKIDIKTALLNQEAIISGIGNYLADEVCYQAKINPKSSCSAIPEDKITELLRVINHVLSVACDLTERNVDFPEDWLFHQRWSKGKSGVKTTGGLAVTFDTVGGRTTAIVAAAQKMYSFRGGGDGGRKDKVKEEKGGANEGKKRKRGN